MTTPNGFSKYISEQYRSKETPEERQKFAEELAYSGLELAPVSGEIIAAKEAAGYFSEGKVGMGLLSTAGAIPFAGGLFRGAGSLVNKIAQNTPTHIPDFYAGNPVKSRYNFAKEFIGSTPAAIRESTDAQAVAKRRVQGISDRKVDDWISDKGQDADLTAISINRQLPNTEGNVLEEGIVGLKFLDSRIPMEDTARLSKGLGQGFREGDEIPESIVNRAMNHLTKGPHIKNPKEKMEFQVKDPSAVKNAGYREAAGTATTSAPVNRAINGKATDSYLKVINKNRSMAKKTPVEKLEGTDMVEFLQMASTLDTRAYQLMKRAGAGDYQPSDMLSVLLAARAKQAAGRPIQKSQQQVLDTFNKLVNAKAIKMARVSDEAGNAVGARNIVDIKKPDGYLVTQQSYISGQQELGGMNSFVVVDPKKEEMYSMLSDGHDMFGQNPIGGHGLITTSPIIKNSYKTGTKWDSGQIATRATEENVEKALKKTEEMTGVPRKKGERPEAYTKRALRTSKPAVTQADRRRALAAKRKLQGTTAVGTGMLAYGTAEAMSDDE
jgi:hypothetical protein